VIVEVTTSAPESLEAELLAVPYSGTASAILVRLDELLEGVIEKITAAGEATTEPGSALVFRGSWSSDVTATRVALVGIGEADEDSIRTAAAAAMKAAKGLGGSVIWAFDPNLPVSPEAQVRAVVEGALLGSHDPARWKTTKPVLSPERLVIAGAPEDLQPAASRAEVVARWTNSARELVDSPPNELTPAGLAAAARELLEPLGVGIEVFGPAEIEKLGLGALTAVGQGSVNEPRLIVLRYAGAGAPKGQRLGLIGKSITFDTGGYFLKPQNDIVKQKADMGGGAAVIGAIGAVAELGLPIEIIGVLPAAENMIGGAAFRPSDIITTAAGLTVEITNTDAEGRLVMADALWYAQQEGATRLVDVATLTGAMRGALGDMYIGVFANDDDWRAQLVAAGNESGDHAWPWPLHRRYRRLLDSPIADIRNTSGRSFGYPIIAASFLERFVGDVPWAHLDIHSTAFLDEERDYLGKGASGAAVRLLTELATGLATSA
jgi:leucyl aminopeptidase